MEEKIKILLKKEYELLMKEREEKKDYILSLQDFFFCDDELYNLLNKNKNDFISKMIECSFEIEYCSIEGNEKKKIELAELMMKEIAEYLKN